MTYTTIRIKNSRNAQRRHLCGPVFNHKTGQIEHRDHWSTQIVKDPDGDPLPHVLTSQVHRAWRSRYERHVGKKQQRKLAARN